MPSHPFIPVANTASVEFIWQCASEISENVIHVEKGSPFSLSDLQALRGVCDTWDSTTWKSARNVNSVLLRIRTKALDTSSSPVEDYYLPTPRAGVASGSALPLNAAFCLKLSTGLGGRSFRGRWYAGNLATSILADAGHVASASVSGFVSNLTALRTVLATAGYTWVVTSFYTGGAWRSSGLNTPITTVVAVNDALDSQRRRLPGRGH